MWQALITALFAQILFTPQVASSRSRTPSARPSLTMISSTGQQARNTAPWATAQRKSAW